MKDRSIEVRVLGSDEAGVLGQVAPGVFDYNIDRHRTAEFMADPRHHLAVAIEDQTVVGMASGVHYVHPDKPPELWVNEVGVSPTHQKRGIAKRLLTALFEHARSLGCSVGWVLTEKENIAARRLYASAGGTESEEIVFVEFHL